MKKHTADDDALTEPIVHGLVAMALVHQLRMHGLLSFSGDVRAS